MKLVIYAGGIGTRLWPLSRSNSPKQFDKFFNGKSTLQLAIERIAPTFGIENIFIQTVKKFEKNVREQVPDLPKGNIFIEPARRNLGPAVCLTVLELEKRGHSGPMAILWADHLMSRPKQFVKALKLSAKLIKKQSDRFVFLGERPRFANNNLGWIKVGDKIGPVNDTGYYAFRGWKYKPSSRECQRLYKTDQAFWNPGYFITSIEFLHEKYKELAPDIYKNVSKGKYNQAEKLHFDRAIIEKISNHDAVVIKTDMGWSDPGTLYALKEALADSKEDCVEMGNVSTLRTSDCLVYNSEPKKLVATVGIDGMVVVNTPDAIVVVPKDEVVHITELVDKLREDGKEKYL